MVVVVYQVEPEIISALPYPKKDSTPEPNDKLTMA